MEYELVMQFNRDGDESREVIDRFEANDEDHCIKYAIDIAMANQRLIGHLMVNYWLRGYEFNGLLVVGDTDKLIGMVLVHRSKEV